MNFIELGGLQRRTHTFARTQFLLPHHFGLVTSRDTKRVEVHEVGFFPMYQRNQFERGAPIAEITFESH